MRALLCHLLPACLWTIATAALADQPARVSGLVLSPGGAPFPGARAELSEVPSAYEQGRMRLNGRPGPEPAATTVSDAAGRFELPLPHSGVWSVRVSAAGRVPVELEPLALSEGAELPPVGLAADAGARFEVRGAGGLPRPGHWVLAESGRAVVAAASGWRPARRVAATDAGGAVAFPRRDDETLRLRVFSPGGVEEVLEGSTGGTVTLALPAPGRRSLRVVDLRGQPVAGVLVRGGDAAWPLGLTAADGRLELAATGKAMRLRLMTADGRQQAARLPPAAEERTPQERTVVLAEATLAGGVVLEEESGRPLPGALVWSGADPGAFRRTDGEGRYQVSFSEGAAPWIEVRAAARLARRLAVEKAHLEARRLPTLALARSVALAGRVVDTGSRALAGAWVTAAPAPASGPLSTRRDGPISVSALSRADGSFLLPRLEGGGLYAVTASKAGYLTGVERAVAGAPARPAAPVRLELAAARAARGLVRDEAGRPVADAEVRLSETRPPGRNMRPEARRATEPPNAVSDASGRFLVAEIPAHTLDLEVSKRGYAAARVRAFKVPPGSGPVELPPVVLRPGASLVGRVVDAGGQSVAGAGVFLVEELRNVSEQAAGLDQAEPDASTGADGRFRLADLQAAVPVHLLVKAAGFLPGAVRGVRPPSRPLLVRLTEGATFHGRVIDSAGAAVAGARVELDHRPTAPGRADIQTGTVISKLATSDREGRVEIREVPPGGATLAVTAEGFVPVEEVETALPQAEGEEQEIVLDRGGSLHGRIATRSGEAIAGVRVMAAGAVGVSDEEGLYRVDGIVLGRQTVEAFHPNYARYSRPLAIEEGENHLDIRFEDGQEVRGQVVDEEGRPVAGAMVRLAPESMSLARLREARFFRALSDAEGTFTLKPVARGSYRLSASAERYADTELAETVTVESEPVAGIEVVLSAGGAIRGRVLGLSAEELPRVALSAEHESGERYDGQVDAGGGFVFEHLPAGDWRLEASLLDGQRHAQARVPLPPNAEVRRDLEFARRFALSGVVLLDDEPLADALVSIRGRDRAVERSVDTDYEGRFRFDDLEADSYWLGLNQPRRQVVHNETVELAADRDLLLRLERARIAGTVSDAGSGGPVADAVVTLRHPAGADGPEYLLAAGSDAAGAFSFLKVPPGGYRLAVASEGFSALEQELVVGAEDVDGLALALEPAPAVEIAVRLASGRLPAVLHLRVLGPDGRVVLADSRPVDAAGVVRLSTVPPGAWTFEATGTGGGLASAPLTVPGEPLALVLPDAARLAVRVPALAASDDIAALGVRAADGRPLQVLGLGGRPAQQWQVVAGKAVVDGVPAGGWMIEVTTPDGRRWASAVATDGLADMAVTVE